ncbi:hypothetical protein [Fibrobacter intestinalis]|uniref:Uncharacterized protein n=1 Tax=Fibrobacter intestinalis TaxID=28122 RepID=A0A1T4K8S8_9BACT|nr:MULTISPECIES: hypothetical protein [Fibrobacter]PBC74944.1 hypothetical protein BGW94_2621 [Fibrobacter sp. NR9]SJZ38850.1 hypothetical protein SAMN02745108_00359 [Fibrobacter intestinalis]
MDAKGKYTRLVQTVKENIDKDKVLKKCLENRNRHQAKNKQLWQKVNLDKLVERFAPGSVPEINNNGKIIFHTPGSDVQLVAEATIGSVRIESLKISSHRKYLDLDGTLRNNITVNGKTRGRTKEEYELATHFRIMKLEEMGKE